MQALFGVFVIMECVSFPPSLRVSDFLQLKNSHHSASLYLATVESLPRRLCRTAIWQELRYILKEKK